MKNITKTELFVLVCLIIIGAALRFYKIEYHSLDDDEAMMLRFNNFSSVQDIITTLEEEPHPPLYFILINQWSKIFGNTLYCNRIFSAIVGSLCCIFICLIALEQFDKKFIFPILILNIFSPSLIWIVQRFRMYALLLLLLYIVLYAYIKINNNNSIKWFFTFVIFSILSIHTHYYGPIFITALFILDFVNFKKYTAKVKKFKLIAYIIILISFIPLSILLSRQMQFFGKQLGDRTWRKSNVIAESLKSGVYYSAGRSAIRTFSFDYNIFKKYFFFIIFPPAILIYLIIKGIRKEPDNRVFIYIFLICIFLTMLINVKIPIFKSSYLLIFAPLLYFYAGVGLAEVGSGLIKIKNAIITSIYFFAIIFSLYQYYNLPNPWQTDWQHIILDLSNKKSFSKNILFYCSPSEAFYFYLKEIGNNKLNYFIINRDFYWYSKIDEKYLNEKISTFLKDIDAFFYIDNLDKLNHDIIFRKFMNNNFKMVSLNSYGGCSLSLWKKQ